MKALLTATALLLISLLCSYSRSSVNSREYQIEIDSDSVTVYDGSRIVGTVPPDSIGALLINDNQ